MKAPNNIFKAYDVRGAYPTEFNEEAARAIARECGRYLKAKTMIVSMDNRPSSPSLKAEVIAGLHAEGIRVIDAGITTTPLFYFAVGTSGADGGIMITASHNSIHDNGLKIVRAGASPVGLDSGLSEIRDAVMSTETMHETTNGAVEKVEYLPAYIELLVRGKQFPKLKIVADAGCGTSGEVLTAFAKRAGITLVPLCFAPCERIAHEGNPLKDENVFDIQKAIVEHGADMGVAFDTDADRVFFFDSSGTRINTHAVASVLASDMLERSQGVSVVYGANMPHVFRDAIAVSGGVPIESKVGHAFIKQKMSEKDALFGCEVSGHYFFKEFYYADSGMLTFALVLDLIVRKGTSLAELAQTFAERKVQSGELNYRVSDRNIALTDIEKEFSDARISKLDGITIEYKDWWCNIRASNTEPLLRVNIEAESKELLSSKREEIEKIIVH